MVLFRRRHHRSDGGTNRLLDGCVEDLCGRHRREKETKTRKQVIAWLAKPYSDSAEYRLWGNGIALPCAVFVLGGITELVENETRGTD